jgi:hypothetical protein
MKSTDLGLIANNNNTNSNEETGTMGRIGMLIGRDPPANDEEILQMVDKLGEMMNNKFVELNEKVFAFWHIFSRNINKSEIFRLKICNFKCANYKVKMNNSEPVKPTICPMFWRKFVKIYNFFIFHF